MKERNGVLVEFPGTTKRKVFYGAGAAETMAMRYGKYMATRLGVTEFSVTNLISARTVVYVVKQCN